MSFRHDVSILEVSSEVCEAIEDVLEEAVAVPMDEGHGTDAIGPLGPIGIVDNGDKIHQDLMKNRLRLITHADGRDHRVNVDA